jgi:hypothetical protein
LTFNLDTDASKVRFEGGEFAIPKAVTEAKGGKATLPISVFEIQLNDNWQIVGVSGSSAPNAETLKQ